MADLSKPNHKLLEEITFLKKRIQQLEETEKELKHTHEMLRNSNDQYRLLADKMTDIVWIQDMNLRTVYVTPSIEKTLGFTPEERVLQNVGEQLTPSSLSLAYDTLAREMVLEQQGQEDPDRTISLELEYYHKDGSTRWIENIMSGIRNNQGTLTGIHGVSRDITARKKLEEALRKSEEKFRHLFEKSVEGILIARGESLEFANPALQRILGHPMENITSEPFISFIHADDKDMVLERHVSRMRGENVQTGYDFRVIASDGTVKWVTINSQVIEWEGAPANLGFIADLTDRKRAEDEKLDLERRLAGAQKLKAIGTLAAGVAHDFNNLLTGIQSYATLMKLALDSSHPHYEKLKHLEELVESGADLTKQLLGFARGGKFEVKPLSMNEVINKTAAMFGRTRKEIKIHETYSDDPCIVEADPTQMEQVFMNLFVNAWHAMPGGGSIKLKTERVVLDETEAIYEGMVPGGYVKITINDTGIGMDEATRAHIFDPFFTTKGMGRGTGLGLATAYGIIKGHGGMIHVESSPGRGSTFTVHFPVSEKEAAEEAAKEDIALRGSETILLVDDEKMVLDASSELLEFLGYRVYPAGSGREAIDLYSRKQDEIDLVILDMIMPGLSGGTTFDHLRQINPGVKVLLASGYSIEGEARKIMDRGCSGFIQKPYPLEKLSRLVRDLLD